MTVYKYPCRAFVENVEKSSCLLEILVWARKPRVCVTNVSHVIINHRSILYLNTIKIQSIRGCVKHKIRNEITIQCVSQFSEVRHEFQFHYAVVNQIAKFEPKL